MRRVLMVVLAIALVQVIPPALAVGPAAVVRPAPADAPAGTSTRQAADGCWQDAVGDVRDLADGSDADVGEVDIASWCAGRRADGALDVAIDLATPLTAGLPHESGAHALDLVLDGRQTWLNIYVVDGVLTTHLYDGGSDTPRCTEPASLLDGNLHTTVPAACLGEVQSMQAAAFVVLNVDGHQNFDDHPPYGERVTLPREGDTAPTPPPPPPPGTGEEPPPPGPDVAAVQQIGGGDDSAVQAAIALSRATFHTAPAILLARDDEFADALASGSVQGMRTPLLLTPPDALDDEVLAELLRLDASQVWVLGGEQAVSAAVAADLADRGLHVQRLSGTTRLETAAAVADAFHPSATEAVLVRAFGDDDPTRAFVDSMSAGALAADLRAPVLLTQTDRLSEATADWLERSQVQTVHVIGGPTAISEAALDDLADLGIDVSRLAGADRAETAIEVARARGLAGADRVLLLDSGSHPDAWVAGFAGSSWASRHDAPVLLTHPDGIPQATGAWLADGTDLVVCGPLLAISACSGTTGQHPSSYPDAEPILDSSQQVADADGVTLSVGDLTVRAPAGAIGQGETLRVEVGDVAAPSTLTGWNQRIGEAFDVTTSQGQPGAAVTVEYRVGSTATGSQTPVLLHEDTLVGGFVPETTTFDAARGVATAQLESFSIGAWMDEFTYAVGAFQGRRFTGGMDCTSPPPWTDGVSLPSGVNDPLLACVAPGTDDDTIVLSLANNRGYAQVLRVRGATFDFGQGLLADSADGMLNRALAQLGTELSRSHVFLAPGASGQLVIHRPEGLGDHTVRVESVHAEALARGDLLLQFVQRFNAFDRVTIPRDVLNCVMGYFLNTLASSPSTAEWVQRMKSCTDAAGSLQDWFKGAPLVGETATEQLARVQRAKQAFWLLTEAIFTVDVWGRWVDSLADGAYPGRAELTVVNESEVDSDLRLVDGDLGTVAPGQEHGFTLAATGGVGPYTVEVSRGAINQARVPAWVTLDPGGRIVLRPPADWTDPVAFYVTITDQGTGRVSPTSREEVRFLVGLADPEILRAPEGDSHYVDEQGVRHWIPDRPTSNCQTGRGTPVRDVGRAEVDALPEGGWHYCFEPTLFHRRVLRHVDGGDAHYVHPDGTRTWIPDPATWECRMRQGVEVVETRWRQYVDAFRDTGWDWCFDPGVFHGNVVRHSVDRDAHFVHPDGTRTWIPDAGTWDCRMRQGQRVVDVRWREYITAFRDTGWDYCYDINVYTGKIMRHSVDMDAHYVDGNGVRHWIPDGGVYECLVARGIPVVNVRWREYIQATPAGAHQTC